MDPRTRDGLLACGTLATLLGALRRRGGDALRDPVAAAAGIAVALLVEWVFLRYPERLLAWWDRPVVNRGSALGVVGGAFLARHRPRLLAAVAWGLATYLALLGRLLLRRKPDEPVATGSTQDR